MIDGEHTIINITVIVPGWAETEKASAINHTAYDNVILQTILNRYEDYGDTVLQNGVEQSLDTLLKDGDMLIIVRKRNDTNK